MAEETKSKRGAGRRPKSTSGERSTPFTTRLAPELREELEKESAATGESLSLVIDRRLRESFSVYSAIQGKRNDHSEQIGDLIKLLARRIEDSTEKAWNEDTFTFRAFLSAVVMFLTKRAPDGDEKTPEAVERYVRNMSWILDEKIFESMDDSTKALVKKAEEAQKNELLKSAHWGDYQAKALEKELLEGRVDLLKGDQSELDLMRQTWIDPEETGGRK